MRSLAILILTGAVVTGCMTVDTRRNPSYNGPRTYSGTRVALANAGGALFALNAPVFAFFMADTVMSSIADTLLLPITLPEQSEWNAARARAARTDLEQPSLIRPSKGEKGSTTARRLFKLCNNLARNLSPKLKDCYSIEAKIRIREDEEDVRELTGTAYKEEILKAVNAKRGTGRFVRFIRPEYTAEDPNVRVRATRIDSDTEERTPIEFLMGPGPDGEWRILEETSVGWAP